MLSDNHAVVGKRVLVALAVLGVALVGVVAWRGMWQMREPVYQGKSLSSWLKVYAPSVSNIQRTQAVTKTVTPAEVLKTLQDIFNGRLNSVTEGQRTAQAAVLEAGTNALPTLLRMLREKDSFLKVKLMGLAQRQSRVEIKYTPADAWNRAGEEGFKVLGASAQSAVPELIEIVKQGISPTSQVCAIEALGDIGPSAGQAVPALLGWATNTNQLLRSAAIRALGRIRAQPKRVLPVPYLVAWAVNAGVYPALQDEARRALLQIDPEAAAKTGVK